MKKFAISLILLGFLVGAKFTFAAQEPILIHGTSCINTTPGVTLIYSGFGVYNPSTISVIVYCPINPVGGRSYTSFSIDVSGYSKNSTTNLVTCSIASVNKFGLAWVSKTASVAFDLYEGRSSYTSIVPNYSLGFVTPYISCNIPAVNSGRYSYLTSINFTGTY